MQQQDIFYIEQVIRQSKKVERLINRCELTDALQRIKQ